METGRLKKMNSYEKYQEIRIEDGVQSILLLPDENELDSKENGQSHEDASVSSQQN